MKFDKDKKFIVLANWKMHKTVSQSVGYIKTLQAGCRDIVNAVEIILCVPFTAVASVSETIGDSLISVGAQNVHESDGGAYTGEISAPMLADVGCRYCLVGHSERRKYFSETDEMVSRKAKALLRAGVAPIVCIGESPDERQRGLTLKKLEKQIVTCFEDFSPEQMIRTVVLYEPIWAIGTGKMATSEQAEEVHQFAREVVRRLFSQRMAHEVRIIYGGSVKWSTVPAILKAQDIDGVAMGSDSLDVHNFIKIAQTCAEFVLT